MIMQRNECVAGSNTTHAFLHAAQKGARTRGPGNGDAEAQPRRRDFFGVPEARQCGVHKYGRCLVGELCAGQTAAGAGVTR
jgi:hypothetical protein